MNTLELALRQRINTPQKNRMRISQSLTNAKGNATVWITLKACPTPDHKPSSLRKDSKGHWRCRECQSEARRRNREENKQREKEASARRYQRRKAEGKIRAGYVSRHGN